MTSLLLVTTALSFLAACGNARSAAVVSKAGTASASTADVGERPGGGYGLTASVGGASGAGGSSLGNYGGASSSASGIGVAPAPSTRMASGNGMNGGSTAHSGNLGGGVGAPYTVNHGGGARGTVGSYPGAGVHLGGSGFSAPFANENLVSYGGATPYGGYWSPWWSHFSWGNRGGRVWRPRRRRR
ncbi:hypothetical protein MTO96_051093 [Rhipicephalus appendiculatus]